MIAARSLITLALVCSGTAPAPAQQTDTPLWTTVPTHIDRSKQHFERLPALQKTRDTRLWLLVPERIKVLDNRSFSFGDGVYQIANIRPISPKRLCQAVEGGRWPCGRMAAIFLGNLVRGKRLLCDLAQEGKTVTLSHCVVGTKDIATAIINQGMGKAEGDDALLAVQAEAQKVAAKGLWRHPKCTTDFDTC